MNGPIREATNDGLSTAIDEQLAYYRARAGEYDEWFLRQGRYDRGEAHRKAWFSEVDRIEAALRDARPSGDILELACGTGLWTRFLAGYGERVHAIDGAQEMIEINRRSVRSGKVEYGLADIFRWEPDRAYDFVFFSFWLSHVPRPFFPAFWDKVRRALKPGGRAFFIDSLLEPDSTAKDHKALDKSDVAERKLNDGSTYSIVKVFYEPAELYEKLRWAGWTGEIAATGRFFFYGNVRPPSP